MACLLSSSPSPLCLPAPWPPKEEQAPVVRGWGPSEIFGAQRGCGGCATGEEEGREATEKELEEGRPGGDGARQACRVKGEATKTPSGPRRFTTLTPGSHLQTVTLGPPEADPEGAADPGGAANPHPRPPWPLQPCCAAQNEVKARG